MSQAGYAIGNLAGAGFRAAINEALAAIVTNNSGATEPATMYAHQWWADTSANLLKRRNAGNTAWVSVMSLSLAISGYMETVLGAGNAAAARVLLNALSSSGGDLSGGLNECRTTVASHATTADIWAALGNSINWTGTATTTTFPAASQAGAKRRLHCAGACTFVNSATLSIIGNADFVATAGAIVDVEAVTTTTFRLIPIKADGTPVSVGSIATPVEVGERSSNTKTVSPAALQGLLVLGTPVPSTSGAAIDFTGIPSWVKRITVMLSSVSTNGTSTVQLQIGAGSIDTTGYLGASGYIVNAGAIGPAAAMHTTGIPIATATSAGDSFSASIVITNMGSNKWMFAGVTTRVSLPGSGTCGGEKTLVGVLDRIRIATTNGTDTFDAGSINILYE